MAVTPTYPGVYVQEVPSGVRAIASVPTAIALFIGRANQGPINRPVVCFNYTDFSRVFSEDATLGDMPRYVKLFFMNGGGQCYAMRIANGASFADVRLHTEAWGPASNTEVLRLVARDAGLAGETLRIAVTYSGPQPEATFNLEIFRWELDATGKRVKRDTETWKNLSMNSDSALYAPALLTQSSKLVSAEPVSPPASGEDGVSRSGRPVPFDSTNMQTFVDAWAALIGNGAATVGNAFRISVDGSRYADVDLSAIDVAGIAAATAEADLSNAIRQAIEDALAVAGAAGTAVLVEFVAGPTPPTAAGDSTHYLQISSTNGGDVFIRPAPQNDVAVPLMLGTEQGGLEVGAYASYRPAPTGITMRTADRTVYDGFATLVQSDVDLIHLDMGQPGVAVSTAAVSVDLATTDPADPMYVDAATTSPNGNNDGVREKLGVIRDAINDFAAANPTFFWHAEVWGSRLAILPTAGLENTTSTTFDTAPTDLAASFTSNVRYASVGAAGTGAFQTPAALVASDGTAPLASDYAAAYTIAEKEIDIFNMLVLPSDAVPAQPMAQLYGPASVFCQQRRAFLLMDAPASWTGVQDALAGVVALRTGLVKDHAAVFYPRLVVNENGREFAIGASGAIAGLAARIDGARGVWKAPAGIEADLRGIVGIDRRFSDPENGALNPRAINTIRAFPTGIVNWGARTMDGDDDTGSEYKYIPIRRLALMMEESLYRGLKWTVFEPNDFPLWAAIRLNVGGFMQGLFRKGAFAGKTPRDAYFVKCDAETTRPEDQNLGIVNIWVGFAPLRPAEFVILYLQQMAAQAEV